MEGCIASMAGGDAGAGTYRGGRPRAWLMRIARNRAISVLRKRKRELPSLEPAADNDGTVATLEFPEMPEIEQALGRLRECLTDTERMDRHASHQ